MRKLNQGKLEETEPELETTIIPEMHSNHHLRNPMNINNRAHNLLLLRSFESRGRKRQQSCNRTIKLFFSPSGFVGKAEQSLHLALLWNLVCDFPDKQGMTMTILT